MWGLNEPSKYARKFRELRISVWMPLQCKGLTSFAQLTLGCWRMTLLFFQHTVVTVELGSLS